MPDWSIDGWCLEDGEARAAAAPSTFEIPPLDVRRALEPGDLAKLIFRIAIDDPEEGDAVERMWVVIRKRRPFGYIGILDNEPDSMAENDGLWVGTELPFEYRHVIDVAPADEASRSIALSRARIPWA